MNAHRVPGSKDQRSGFYYVNTVGASSRITGFELRLKLTANGL
jgi:hypothetical protein